VVFKYILTGKVLPERVNFQLSSRTIVIDVPEFDFNFGLILSIAKSQIMVQIISENQVQDYETLRNIVVDVVRLHVDIDGYIQGHGYDIEITSIAGENNIPHIIFGIQIDEIEKDSVNRPIQNIDEIVSKFGKPEYNFLRLSLIDLQLSIKFPKDTGVFCYRAIESIMQYFNEGDNTRKSRKQAWMKFDSNLNVSREWVDFVRKFALDPRHGRPKSISGSERIEVMKHTWKIVDRFILYLDKNESLDNNEFPELK